MLAPEVQHYYFNGNIPCFIPEAPHLLLLRFGHKSDFKNIILTSITASGPVSQSQSVLCGGQPFGPYAMGRCDIH